jgi:hypothetical protein
MSLDARSPAVISAASEAGNERSTRAGTLARGRRRATVRMEGYGTPEEAARGDMPERFARIVWLERSADRAVVLLEVNSKPPYFDLARCWVEEGRWGCDSEGERVTSAPSSMRSGSPNLARLLSESREPERWRKGGGGLGPQSRARCSR